MNRWQLYQRRARIRQNLTLIANNLGGDPDIPDPHRLTAVLDDANSLAEDIL